MTDLEILKKWEKQLGIKFEKVDVDVFQNYTINTVDDDTDSILNTDTSCYAINAEQQIIGLSFHSASDNADISILTNLTKLRSLYLSGNQIIDISVLQNLTNLKKLWLSNNQITNISVLKNLINLENLDLSSNQITDISVLKNLTNLENLDLSSNQITDISALQHLTNLKSLWLSDNQFTDISVLQHLIHLKIVNLFETQITDISVLKNLINLENLDLSSNQITDISVLKNLTNLENLDLSSNQITDISALQHLTNLKSLWLSDNQFTDISVLQHLTNLESFFLSEIPITDISVLQNLTNLTILLLSKNKITDISVLQHLTNLQILIISGNQITDISPLQKLVHIKLLFLNNNQIKDISPIKALFKKEDFGFGFENNPLKYPPKEIVELGKEAINEYFDHAEQGTTVLQEAKLIIIGEAGAGKTTFAARIQNPQALMPKPDDTTLGVAVSHWNFSPTDANHLGFHAKLWDFGGQDIYHGTHQFFFSHNALYVLLADTREQKTDFNYWLNTVEQITGEDSPLIIVLNKKQKHTWRIDEPGLRNRFGNIIRQVISIDLSQPAEIPTMQHTIQTEIQNLPHIGYTLPTSWVSIRHDLSKLDDKFISFSDFRKICKNNGITNPHVVTIISKLFANIGVFTHFADDFSSLHDIIFLDSNWLTKTVYLLLNSETVKEKHGRIHKQEIKEIWQGEEAYFEINKFIELLKKFSLIYKINGSDNYIVPEHLPMVQPYNQWQYANESDVYQFRYLFDNYMPKGIMPKLIVALHQYIYNHDLVWHRGVNITNSVNKPDTYAEIIETYGRENRFDIRIYGKKQKDLLQIIIYHFDSILKPFKKLTHEKLVPCNCDTCKTATEPHFYKYHKLLEREEKGRSTIECEKSFEPVNVKDLLYGFTDSELRSLLLNEKFEEFEKAISQRFADLSYQVQKQKVSEGYFHGIFHTILAENGLNPVSEESTNDGRIDIHLTIGQTKYLFELKIDKTADEALKQIREKEYYRKFERDFHKIVLIGVNFSTRKRNIQGIKYAKIEV